MSVLRGSRATSRAVADDSYRAAPPPPGAFVEPRIHNPPVAGQWDPIVIDEPTLPFDVRPSPGRQPDTICDGWTTADLVVRLASVRGNAHRQAGQFRQDHAGAVLHPETGSVVFAVLDGVSSAPLSHIGARLAGVAACSALWDMLDRGRSIDWSGVVRASADAVLSADHARPAREGSVAGVERRFGTTLVAGIARPTRTGVIATMVRVGDSGAWFLRGTDFRTLFPPKWSGHGTVSSAVAALPRLPDLVEPVEVQLTPGSVLLVGTDGIGDPLGDGSGLVGALLATALAEPPPPLGLAHTIDFSRDTFDDDRTLIAVWPRSAVR